MKTNLLHWQIARSLSAIPETIFLCEETRWDLEVVRALESKGLRVAHTFGEDDMARRRQKLAFRHGDAKVKATTFHSFKGWEARALVAYLAPCSAGTMAGLCTPALHA